MLRLITAFAALLMTLAAACAAPAETILGEWTDAARAGRVVPYKIYLPNIQSPSPVVVFSHGLGGNRDGAEYLLRHLAENGYVTVAVQHPGSDTPSVFGAAAENGGIREATTPAVAADRFRDIPFAIDELAKMNAGDARLRGKLDMSRLGMSGHSYGAVTTLALAGQGFGPRARLSFADERIKAAIAYSPNKPRQGDPAEQFASIRIPTFHMTGTEDKNPLDESDPVENRQVPYRSIKNADKYLIVFTGGDHMIFSGRRFQGGPRPGDETFHALIQKSSLAYWDAYLKGNAEAKTYLTAGGFAKDLGSSGTFELHLR
ncbi:MAG: alpha/beta fold hydrolase [Micropepsaceae bacterium]